VDFKLTLVGVEATVEVNAAPPLLNTLDGTVGQIDVGTTGADSFAQREEHIGACHAAARPGSRHRFHGMDGPAVDQ
jgi:molybdopterin/thiamine biosynthesis adenylyltransferase